MLSQFANSLSVAKRFMSNLKDNGRCPNDLQQKQRAGVLAGSTGNTPKDEVVAATPTLLDFRWSHVHIQKTQRAGATSSSAVLRMQLLQNSNLLGLKDMTHGHRNFHAEPLQLYFFAAIGCHVFIDDGVGPEIHSARSIPGRYF